MARYFTLAEAQAALPEVETAIRQAVRWKRLHQEAEAELQGIMKRIGMLGGAQIHAEQVVPLRQRRDHASSELRSAIGIVQETGCQVKDLDAGLVDFPTLYHDEEVLLCWKLGEDGIQFWHGLSDGFAGRKRIDQEFLENHRGDSPN